MSNLNGLRAAVPPGEDNLEVRQEPYQPILDALSTGAILVDRSGRMRSCNSRARQLFQYRRVDLLNRQLSELFEHGARGHLNTVIADCLLSSTKNGHYILPEPRGLRRDGSYFPVEIHLRKAQLDDEELIVCTLRDISKRRQNEADIRTKEEKIRMALQGAELWSWEYDFQTRLISYSVQYSSGRRPDDSGSTIALDDWLELVDEKARPHVKSCFDKLESGESRAEEFEFKARRKSGRWDWFHSSGKVIDHARDGRPQKAGGINLNISERKNALEKLKESEERFRSAFNQSAIPMLLVSHGEGIFRVNQAMCSLTGYEEKELLSKELIDLVHPDDRVTVKKQMGKTIKGIKDKFTLESRYLTRDGDTRFVSANVVSIRGGCNEFRYSVVQLTDITEEHNLSTKLVHEATHDSLTGLVNRREFENRLAGTMSTIAVEKSENALAYLDLDQFKVINDTCGHAAGDELLRQLSTMIRKKLRRGDVVARLGGDEFGVFMESCSLEQARLVIRKIHDLVSNFRFVWEDKTFNVTMSSGLVAVTEDSGDLVEVLKRADSACYAAKDAGRNRLHVFCQEDEELTRRSGEMQWVSRINKALEEDRFQLFCQPIAAISNPAQGRLYYEVLLRLREEDGTLVPPGAFLPAAERYGLSIRLDKWVVSRTLGWLSKHPEHVSKLDLCCINLSGNSLGDTEVLAFIEKQLARTGVPAEKICFEITETAAISNLGNATAFIKSLKKQGCLFALDDFGSGLSSFAYLKSLEVDILKIDGTFVREIASDPVDQAMVRSINEIGKVLGKYTTAEFVENDEILKVLHEIGVDRAQGYGISKPMPLEEVDKLS